MVFKFNSSTNIQVNCSYTTIVIVYLLRGFPTIQHNTLTELNTVLSGEMESLHDVISNATWSNQWNKVPNRAYLATSSTYLRNNADRKQRKLLEGQPRCIHGCTPHWRHLRSGPRYHRGREHVGTTIPDVNCTYTQWSILKTKPSKKWPSSRNHLVYMCISILKPSSKWTLIYVSIHVCFIIYTILI